MSETVIVAIITLASGIAGSIIGAIFNYKITMLSVKSEQSKMLHDEKKIVYSEMIYAYTNFMDVISGIESGSIPFGDESAVDAVLRFYKAETSTLLLAPKSMIPLINTVSREFISALEARKLNMNKSSFDALVDAMRKDLLAFYSGTKGTQWFQKFRKVSGG